MEFGLGLAKLTLWKLEATTTRIQQEAEMYTRLPCTGVRLPSVAGNLLLTKIKVLPP